MTAMEIRRKLRSLADKQKAKLLQGFFKTGPGQYGEGDVFIGITVPVLRKTVKECRDAGLTDIAPLLRSPIHEERLCALLLLIQLFKESDQAGRDKVLAFYLKNTRYVNNWDLVDLSAPAVVGAHLLAQSRKRLYQLAGSPDLWERRIAIVATFSMIRQNDFSDTLKIAELLMGDDHDLIHKAVGWMLREVGKRDVRVLEDFLRSRYALMPRTMLRYAIERLPEARRKRYLNGTI